MVCGRWGFSRCALSCRTSNSDAGYSRLRKNTRTTVVQSTCASACCMCAISSSPGTSVEAIVRRARQNLTQPKILASAHRCARISTSSSWRSLSESSACNRSEDDQRFVSADYGFRQRIIRRIVRQIFIAREKSNERAPIQRGLIANRSAQRRVHVLESIEHAPQRHGCFHFKRDFVARSDLRVPEQRRWKLNANATHASVCTSTENTGGRCSAIVVQLSPPLGEQ